MKLSDMFSRLKGLVRKSPAKGAKATKGVKPTLPAPKPSKRAEVKRARKQAGTNRKRG